jgi:predicted outer membrane repeat protein
MAITVTTTTNAALLTAAALCSNATIRAEWQGDVQLLSTIIVGDGTTLTIIGAGVNAATIDGDAETQLFEVYGLLIVRNVTLTNGVANEKGGAILVQPSGVLNITGSVLTSNRAPRGGSIYCTSGASCMISDCEFSRNHASEEGGAVHDGRENEGTIISNTAFIDNHARYGAAVFSSISSVLVIHACNFRANNARDKGGAWHGEERSAVTVSASVFTSNSALYNGGAMSSTGKGNVTIKSSKFKNNSVNGDGGGGAVYSGGSVFAVDVNFSNNRAARGAAVQCSEAREASSFRSCEFIDNAATALGAAIYGRENSELVISSSNFRGNVAHSFGGAIFTEGRTNVSLSDCKFTSNRVRNVSGGAIGISVTSTVLIDTCQFEHNSAPFYGGSIYVYTGSEVKVLNSSFTNNSAAVGAALVAAPDSTMTLIGVTMRQNTATVSGGCIYT